MCVQLCVNTAGSYHCQCNSGYRLSSDGFDCEGIYVLDYTYMEIHMQCNDLIPVGTIGANASSS